MNILFVLGKYLPYRTAGMENYTHWVAGLLVKNGHKVIVATLEGPLQKYEHDAVEVYRLQNTGEAFHEVLVRHNIDICHFQEYSAFGGIEIPMFETAAKVCKKTFFTFHLPYFTCYKNDFRYLGKADCSTFSNINRCCYCIAYSKLKEKLGWNENFLRLLALPSRGTAFNRSLAKRVMANQSPFASILKLCNTVFVYPDWFYKLLRDNGCNSVKVVQIPYKNRPAMEIEKKEVMPVLHKRLLFAGRIQHEKGLHLLTEALALLKDENLQLDVFGNIIDEDYYKQCMQSFKFNFKGTLPLAELIAVFNNYDFLVLPSMFPEMFSLIIKDAFNSGLPVIVSSSKGNTDAVCNGINGFIFEYGNATSLAATIKLAQSKIAEGWTPNFGPEHDADAEEAAIVSYYN